MHYIIHVYNICYLILPSRVKAQIPPTLGQPAISVGNDVLMIDSTGHLVNCTVMWKSQRFCENMPTNRLDVV